MSFRDLDALLDEEGAHAGDDAESRPLVLVVDDDPTMRKSLEAVLSQKYEVVLCASAKEGVKAADENVCAIVLDIKMKGYDGFWACNEIRKKLPGVQVIFYSAYQDLKDPYDVINEHRPLGYITKDGDVRKLLSAVETAVRLSKMAMYGKMLADEYHKRRNPSR